MPFDTRVEAAEAFWRDDESPEIAAQHVEAIVAIANRLKFRPRSVQNLPVDRRARYLAQLADVSDAIATRALIAYHFTTRRPLMSAFLDALGIAHEDGLIADEELTPPAADALAGAVETIKGSFPSDEVELYLRTLAALDGDTWIHLDGLLASRT